MGQNNRKFRLRLNFFDCAVILIALAAAGLLLLSLIHISEPTRH